MNVIELFEKDPVSIWISIISLIVSIIAVIFTAIPVIRKYWEDREKITLVACNGRLINNTLYIVATYVSRNWQNATIVHSHIHLSMKNSFNRFTQTNHECRCVFFKPIILSGKMHASVELKYPLPDLKDAEINDVTVSIQTDYIGTKGERKDDSTVIGRLHINDIKVRSVGIFHSVNQLKGRKTIISMQL